jgi:hypothetical protein
MVLMLLVGALLSVGPIAIWRWGSLEVRAPWRDEEEGALPPREAVRRFFWYATVGIGAGVLAGVVMFGAGGRLAMRLLAVTSGSEAQGAVTEAEEIVGDITFDGTVGLILFFGILGGGLFGVLYMGIRRWLPHGRWGGVVYGLGLFVLFATRIEPLRAANPDFDIVRPGWLSIVLFTTVMVGYGMLVASVAGRYSSLLPLLKKDVGTVAKHLPAYLPWGPGALILVPPLAIGSAAVWLTAGLRERFAEILSAPRTLIIGRTLGLLLLAIALPTFVVDVADIATR